MTVNHSITFKNAETGAHSNTIEGLWYHAKGSCPRHNRAKQHFLGYLATFILQRKWRDEEDSFAMFMRTAANLYNGDDSYEVLNPGDYIDDNE